MPDAPTFDDLLATAQAEALVRQPSLSVDAVTRPGADANAILAAGAAAADQVVGAQLVPLSASLFLDSALGPQLDRLVFDRYGLIRKPAAPALASVQFTTPTNTSVAFTIPVNTLLQTADGTQFVTTEAVTFPAASSGPVLVGVRSVLAGAKQQAAIGTITSIVAPISGAPSGLAVSNPLATAGAADAESDDSLRSRAQQFFTTARRGTLKAIEQGALAVAGVQTAKAIEVTDASGRPNKVVLLAITDQFTNALLGSNPATYQTQSQQLAQAVYNGLSDVRGAGIYVQVQVAVVIMQSVLLNLRFYAGVDQGAVAIAARMAVVNYINNLAPGATFSYAAAEQLLAAVWGLDYQGDEIVTPAGDVVPLPLQVLRTTVDLVTPIVPISTASVLTTNNPDAYILSGHNQLKLTI